MALVRTRHELIARADRALYRAKETGRDRTVVDAGSPGAGAPGEHSGTG
jgi:predicted signal transduction protein with EAL and GGDEF domain